MKKGTIIGLAIFIILSSGLFLLFTNLQIEIFPGNEHRYDFFVKKEIWEEKSVSLVTVLNPDLGSDGELGPEDTYSKLSITGYGMAALMLLGIPFILTWPFARRYNRRAARKAEAANGQQPNA